MLQNVHNIGRQGHRLKGLASGQIFNLTTTQINAQLIIISYIPGNALANNCWNA